MSRSNRDGGGPLSSTSANTLFAIGFVVVCVACAVLYLQYDADAGELPEVAPMETTPVSTPAESNAQDEAGTENGDEAFAEEPRAEIPRGEWYMRLVNYDNLLEEDFETEVVDVGGSYYFDARAADDLLALLDAARDAGAPLRIASASRSWQNQQAQYEARVAELVDEGVEPEAAETQATRENMLPAASEHILSLGLDLAPEGMGELDESILDDPAYQWLVEHAHEYGFIRRYPTGMGYITGIDFEPWHFRYVGPEQAALIYESGLTLEEYLA